MESNRDVSWMHWKYAPGSVTSPQSCTFAEGMKNISERTYQDSFGGVWEEVLFKGMFSQAIVLPRRGNLEKMDRKMRERTLLSSLQNEQLLQVARQQPNFLCSSKIFLDWAVGQGTCQGLFKSATLANLPPAKIRNRQESSQAHPETEKTWQKITDEYHYPMPGMGRSSLVIRHRNHYPCRRGGMASKHAASFSL